MVVQAGSGLDLVIWKRSGNLPVDANCCEIFTRYRSQSLKNEHSSKCVKYPRFLAGKNCMQFLSESFIAIRLVFENQIIDIRSEKWLEVMATTLLK